MALPTSPSRWSTPTQFPKGLLEADRTDFELFETDDEFVLSVEMPGFDCEEITLSWDTGVLSIAAEQENENRGEQKTYYRRFRFPKNVDDEAIQATYSNGILEVRLPVTGTMVPGTEIEVET